MEEALEETGAGPTDALGERWDRDWVRGMAGSSERWPEEGDGEGAEGGCDRFRLMYSCKK